MVWLAFCNNSARCPRAKSSARCANSSRPTAPVPLGRCINFIGINPNNFHARSFFHLPGPVTLTQRDNETLAQPPSEEEWAIFNIGTRISNHSDRSTLSKLSAGNAAGIGNTPGRLGGAVGMVLVMWDSAGTTLVQCSQHQHRLQQRNTRVRPAPWKMTSCALAERCCPGRMAGNPWLRNHSLRLSTFMIPHDLITALNSVHPNLTASLADASLANAWPPWNYTCSWMPVTADTNKNRHRIVNSHCSPNERDVEW